mgnify:CR=1 FL=1
MRLINWVLGLALFILILGFAIKNSHPVVVKYFLGYQSSAPLILILLIAFIAGVIVAVLASLSIILNQQRELRKYRGTTVQAPDTAWQREP